MKKQPEKLIPSEIIEHYSVLKTQLDSDSSGSVHYFVYDLFENLDVLDYILTFQPEDVAKYYELPKDIFTKKLFYLVEKPEGIKLLTKFLAAQPAGSLYDLVGGPKISSIAKILGQCIIQAKNPWLYVQLNKLVSQAILNHNKSLDDDIIDIEWFAKKSPQAFSYLTSIGYEFSGCSLTSFMSQPLITGLKAEERAKLDSITINILSKTYSDITELEDRNIITDKLVNGLQSVVKSPWIAMVLDVTSGRGNISLVKDKNIEMGCYGEYRSGVFPHITIYEVSSENLSNENASALEQFVKFSKIINFIIHESTHMMMDLLFQNDCKPYVDEVSYHARQFQEITDQMIKLLKNNSSEVALGRDNLLAWLDRDNSQEALLKPHTKQEKAAQQLQILFQLRPYLSVKDSELVLSYLNIDDVATPVSDDDLSLLNYSPDKHTIELPAWEIGRIAENLVLGHTKLRGEYILRKHGQKFDQYMDCVIMPLAQIYLFLKEQIGVKTGFLNKTYKIISDYFGEEPVVPQAKEIGESLVGNNQDFFGEIINIISEYSNELIVDIAGNSSLVEI